MFLKACRVITEQLLLFFFFFIEYLAMDNNDRRKMNLYARMSISKSALKENLQWGLFYFIFFIYFY